MTGRGGIAKVISVVLMSARVSRAAEWRTAVKDRAAPSRQAASPKIELLSRAKGSGEAVEVVQLSEDAVDELDAKDGAPACKLPNG
eukprot:6189631-Pleurochrysis_carterae.AAC.2